MVVFTNVKKEDIKKLDGFMILETKTVYEDLRLKMKGVTLILYKSNKLLLQGNEKNVELVEKFLKKKGVGKIKEGEYFRKETGWMIGSDETLKGDTFGGLVVAAVKADSKIRKKLMEIGVADSKKLKDEEIVILAERIKDVAPCEIKSILPLEYNKSSKQGGVTYLLNKHHKSCANYLFPGKHIVDKYPGCAVGDIMETKAESKYVEVAAASVLARAAGLKQLSFLSWKAGFTVPKGSTHVKEALRELKRRKLDFKRFVKVDFRNVKEFL